LPWTTPSLADLRKQSRDAITASLGARTLLPNSVARVLSDANAALAYLTLLYVSWVAKQLLPDTAETEWLDRHADIWLASNARKAATFASGTVTLTGINGTAVPAGTRFTSAGSLEYETTALVTIGAGATSAAVEAIDAGALGNQDAGETLTISSAISGVDATATVVSISGGADEETDDELRGRVLDRIRKPPMGGDADDYVAWALEVPGVTRAWCAPREMGAGSVTVRFMMDDLRADPDPSVSGFPLSGDVAAVQAHIDSLRPVTAQVFVEAPIPEPINYTVTGLTPGDASTKAASEASVAAMLRDRGAPAYALAGVLQPAQTIYAAWVAAAITDTPGVNHFDLTMSDHPMPDNGHIAVMGTATYV
jgi:uncharacterized phage protein gp47/JayE